MTIFYLGAAFLAGVGVLLLSLGLHHLTASRSEVDERLSPYSAAAAAQMSYSSALEEQAGLTDRFNAFLSERSFSGSVAASLARAGVKLTVSEWVLIKIAATLTPFLVFALLHQQLVGVLLAVVGFMLPDMWLRRRERSRRDRFVLQLPDTLSLIVGGLRAGFSLQHALQNVARQAPEPTASEFNRLSQELQLGVPLMGALDNLVRRIQSDDLEMIVSVFKIQSRVGGNLSTVLDTVASTIRERVKLRREIKVITSMQRLSGYILGLLPVFLAAAFFVLNRGYIMEIFHWNIFLCIPVGAFVLNVVGFLVIRKIVDINI